MCVTTYYLSNFIRSWSRAGGGGSRDDGVYRYDYDDFDIPKTTTGGTTIGRSRCVDTNGIVIPCDGDGVDDGLEVVTTR